MKTQNVPLDLIVWNPFRDKKLHPLDPEQVARLKQSINDHGFFGGIKVRRRDGKYQLACGHHRIEAAKRARLDSVSIVVDDDMDDDAMVRLMADENATQGGNNPGAVMNEVAAVTKRLIEMVLTPEARQGRSVPVYFDGKRAFDVARGRLLKRLDDPDKDAGIGYHTVLRYLGKGDEKASHRGERQIREAVAALKQAGRYDDLVDDALRTAPAPAVEPTAESTAIAKPKKPKKPRRRVLDERTANLFPNDNQFGAFREAVTTPSAQKMIPVDQQYALAKDIMDPESEHRTDDKRQASVPYIKMRVQKAVQEAMQKQREIDKEEREQYLAEQREARIDDVIHNANGTLRMMLSALAKLNDLADEFPGHPKLGGFSARLDTLNGAIEQFSRKLKFKKAG